MKKWADKYGISVDIVQINDYVESINQYTAGAYDGVALRNKYSSTPEQTSSRGHAGISSAVVMPGSHAHGSRSRNQASILSRLAGCKSCQDWPSGRLVNSPARKERATSAEAASNATARNNQPSIRPTTIGLIPSDPHELGPPRQHSKVFHRFDNVRCYQGVHS